MTNMLIPTCYYHKDILKLIDRQISDGINTFDALDELDREEIVGQCIWHGAYDQVSDDASAKIAKFVLHGTTENAMQLAEQLREDAIEHFSDIVNALLEERASENRVALNISAGLRPIQDKINGEIRWI